jgi:hypothetical protein
MALMTDDALKTQEKKKRRTALLLRYAWTVFLPRCICIFTCCVGYSCL